MKTNCLLVLRILYTLLLFEAVTATELSISVYNTTPPPPKKKNCEKRCTFSCQATVGAFLEKHNAL